MTKTRAWLGSAIALAAALYSAAALAQSAGDPISQAVVQPLPPAGVSDLNSALQRLARNSRDVNALLDAGTASIKLNDIDAAIGFFGRAEELSPNNPRTKVGLAAAYTRKQRPLDALQLFDDAERAGASTDVLASDRGLAYDLVGDNASARQHYEIALARGDNAETRQRLALNHAIAGDRAGFERVLAPLIAKGDSPSYRTKTFGLAILGEDAEAVAIAEAVMPRNLSAQIAPYLRYMPRLTRAQQAAAANLGIFPRAAQIGRDAPQIAQYAGSAASRGADARLAPQGEPLGKRPDSTSPRRRPDRGRSSVQATPEPTKQTQARLARTDRSAASDPSQRTTAPRRIRVKASEVVQPERIVAAATAPVEVPKPTPKPTPAPVTVPEPVEVVAIAAATPVSLPARQAITNANPDFDLAKVGNETPAPVPVAEVSIARVTPTPTLSTTPAPARAAISKPVVQSAPESVAEAFANFSLQPRTGVAVANGGVDIRAIEPPREIAKVAEAQSEQAEHPKRFWVQIATGRDIKALGFDWRRISRKSPDTLDDKAGFITPWGQTNRLLSGPFGSPREARNAVSALKEDGVDSFTYTSPEGEKIDKIP